MSQPHDPDEREADRVADMVMRGEPASGSVSAMANPPIQRKCAECASGGGACPACAEEEEERMQRKAAPGSHAQADPGTMSPAGTGQPLGTGLRDQFEPLFGRDFGVVRLHTDHQAADSARALNAQAYTLGRDIVFGAGQFDPGSSTGRRLLAHELTHVVQQAEQAQPAVQRQGLGGPLDLRPDVCVTVPGLGTLCGQAAADACKKAPIPGCGLVCKVFDCSKPKQPKTLCPPGWRAAASKEFEGQCCLGTADSATGCCPPDRIAMLDQRCCGSDEVVMEQRCKKSSDLPPLPPSVLCPPSQRTLQGECCVSPMIPKGLHCGFPEIKPPPKPPQPVLPAATEIFFKLDRPSMGEPAASLAGATTAEGLKNFNVLAENLRNNPTLKVQLVGRASPEGTEAYNLDLGARRARMVAEALQAAGVSASQLDDPAPADLASECQSLGTGLATCGKANATGPRDRQVLARSFQPAMP